MFIDSSLIINVDYFKSIEKDAKCPICSGIINQPIQCDSCKHSMCKECSDSWFTKNTACPFKCEEVILIPNESLRMKLCKLIFKCKLGCGKEIFYSEYIEHMILKCPKLEYQKKCDELLKRIAVLTKENDKLTKLQKKLIVNETYQKDKAHFDAKIREHPCYMIEKKTNTYSTVWGGAVKDAAHGGITEPNLTYKTIAGQNSQLPDDEYDEENYDE